MTKCELCDRECKNALSLAMHVTKAHKITCKEYYDEFINTGEEDKCPTCGKHENTFLSIGRGYTAHCSEQCSTLDPNVQETYKETNRAKYGVDFPMQSELVKDKSKQTCLDKFGVEYSFQAEEVKEKIKQTHLKNLGVEHPMQNTDIIRKTQDSINRTRRANKNRSKIELYFEEICNKHKIKFEANYEDDRYKPEKGRKWKCDFYIPDNDLFIEIHFMATHNDHIFNKDNEEDQKWLLHCIQEPKNWVEEQQVKVWANADVRKILKAKFNKLNYIILWNYEDIDRFFELFISNDLDIIIKEFGIERNLNNG